MEKYLEQLEVSHRIRDPIHGFVYLTEAERRIIDTPLFQRLRRIHQLALTKYVYPSAEHSRFVHSLGVMHCATLILAGVFGNRHTIHREPKRTQIKTMRFAALLHDIGHLPLSHAAEKQLLQGAKHEDVSQYIIEHDATIKDIIYHAEVDPGDVAALLAKRPQAENRLLHEIISGHLDADRADYLLRDSLLCGVRYGEYDYARFLQIFAATEDKNTGELCLSVDESDLHVAESLLLARYHYSIQVLYHRTRSGYDFVYGRFLQDCNLPEINSIFNISDKKLLGVDLDAFTDFDDYTIIQRAKALQKSNPWAKMLLRQDHLIPLLDTSSTSRQGTKLFKEFKKALQNQQQLVADEDYFIQHDPLEIVKGVSLPGAEQPPNEDGPPQEGQAEDPSRKSKKPTVPSGFIKLRSKEGKTRTAESVDICERSWIFKKFIQRDDHSGAEDGPFQILRVYVTPGKQKEARDLLQQTEKMQKGEQDVH